MLATILENDVIDYTREDMRSRGCVREDVRAKVGCLREHSVLKYD